MHQLYKMVLQCKWCNCSHWKLNYLMYCDYTLASGGWANAPCFVPLAFCLNRRDHVRSYNSMGATVIFDTGVEIMATAPLSASTRWSIGRGLGTLNIWDTSRPGAWVGKDAALLTLYWEWFLISVMLKEISTGTFVNCVGVKIIWTFFIVVIFQVWFVFWFYAMGPFTIHYLISMFTNFLYILKQTYWYTAMD